MNKALVHTLFVASALAASATASAQPPILVEGRPTAIVSYGDLDLAHAAGQSVLNRRVRHAANLVCTSGARAVAVMMAERRCFSAALAEAQPRVEQAIALAGNRQFAGGAALSIAAR